jgi:PhnB protein
MKLNPYLIFDGQCEAAFRFYEKCLGGRVEAMMPFRDSPACNEVPAEARDRIMHARLDIGDQALMGSDTTPQHPYEGVRGIHVSINVDGPEEAERIWAALAEGGTVQMPLQQTFWAARFGMVVDRFGTPWMINSPPAS